jgi:hypothetical protein
MTTVELVDRRIEIQLLHLLPKPICCITSIRKSHLTVSKAFAISSLRNKPDYFDLWRVLMRF